MVCAEVHLNIISGSSAAVDLRQVREQEPDGKQHYERSLKIYDIYEDANM